MKFIRSGDPAPMVIPNVVIFAQLREDEKAFEWLERLHEERNYALMYLKVAPNFDPVRSDPRFDNLLRRLGLAA